MHHVVHTSHSLYIWAALEGHLFEAAAHLMLINLQLVVDPQLGRSASTRTVPRAIGVCAHSACHTQDSATLMPCHVCGMMQFLAWQLGAKRLVSSHHRTHVTCQLGHSEPL